MLRAESAAVGHALRSPDQTDDMRSMARAQLRTIFAVVETLQAAHIRAWLFGGWALDARVGRLTRDHSDIEFWLDRADDQSSRTALVNAGAAALTTQPPEEPCEFTWDAVEFSTAYFDRQPDGTFTPQGRWSDWVFPSGSFGEDYGTLDGVRVPVMSAGGMLAMKEEFPRLRNGRAWRPKDLGDIETLRTLIEGGTPDS